jgi:hypothetical protein
MRLFARRREAGISVFVHQLSPVAVRMTDFPSRRAATAGSIRILLHCQVLVAEQKTWMPIFTGMTHYELFRDDFEKSARGKHFAVTFAKSDRVN